MRLFSRVGGMLIGSTLLTGCFSPLTTLPAPPDEWGAAGGSADCGSPLQLGSYCGPESRSSVVLPAPDPGTGATPEGPPTGPEGAEPLQHSSPADEQPVPVADRWPAAPPIEVPAWFPIAVPAAAPTALPTAAPVALPTAIPTPAPVALPVDAPTLVPIVIPADLPPGVPTAAPTATPTPAPTATPTPAPGHDDEDDKDEGWKGDRPKKDKGKGKAKGRKGD